MAAEGTAVADTCRFEGCLNEVERNGWCAGHRKQLQRGKPLTALQPRNTQERIRMAREQFEAACQRLEAARDALKAELDKRREAYCNADSEDDAGYLRLQQQLWQAVDDYARFRLVIDPFLPMRDRLVPGLSPRGGGRVRGVQGDTNGGRGARTR